MPALEALRSAVESHTGVFSCSEIHNDSNTKTVQFRHVAVPAVSESVVPDIAGLRDFYDTFAQLTLYAEESSGEAAFVIGSPSDWAELDEDFRPWLDGLDEEEVADLIPDWVNSCFVVGEVPHSGNYLLLATDGPDTGKVFAFDHDGFEFNELGTTLPDFVARTLDLDSRRLTAIASHIRFIAPNENRQWWINELRDNRGNVVRTEA